MSLELIWDIFIKVLAPVLAVVGLGAAVQRWQALSMQTLTRLNIYLFVPVFLFDRISKSDLSWDEIGGVAVVVLVPMAVIGFSMHATMRRAKARAGTIATVLVGGIFFNAGNFGIPVAELAFGEAGGEVQSLVVMFMNTSVFFLGYVILAAGHGQGWRSAVGYFKLPMIYAIVLALLVKEGVFTSPPPWLDEAVGRVSAGMVPVALITLGAQLAKQARWPRWRVVLPAVSLKLLVIPAATTGLVILLDVLGWELWPWPGAQLILASAAPTAVNTLLLTLELDGDSEAAADCVFWSTMLSAATVTVVLTVLWTVGGDALPGPG